MKWPIDHGFKDIYLFFNSVLLFFLSFMDVFFRGCSTDATAIVVAQKKKKQIKTYFT